MSQGFQIQLADAKKNSHAQTKKKDLPEMRDIAILNNFLCARVLMGFGIIKFISVVLIMI
jgi:hypothetical protein